MEVPKEYEGREHTWLKHRVLSEYLVAWAHKLGSTARHRGTRLWYVDCFAGPWKTKDEDLRDTSIHIGLEALETAVRTWRKQGYAIEVGAVLVEKSHRAFDELQAYLGKRATRVAIYPLRAEFAEAVPRIEQIIGSDAAFVFVDPTGWKGVGMRHIAPLVAPARRDVIVNVMFDHLNRFKDDPREFLRKQMREFFGLGQAEIQPDLAEEELMAVYRSNLKQSAGLSFAADLAVPHPVKERTKLRLVVGGHNAEVVRLFRDVERRVIGREAAPVRARARAREQEARTRQIPLIRPAAPEKDSRYTTLHKEGLSKAQSLVIERIQNKATSYGALWPVVLESCHITESDLKKMIGSLANEGKVVIEKRSAGERTVKDHHVVAPAHNRE